MATSDVVLDMVGQAAYYKAVGDADAAKLCADHAKLLEAHPRS